MYLGDEQGSCFSSNVLASSKLRMHRLIGMSAVVVVVRGHVRLTTLVQANWRRTYIDVTFELDLKGWAGAGAAMRQPSAAHPSQQQGAGDRRRQRPDQRAPRRRGAPARAAHAHLGLWEARGRHDRGRARRTG
jgi:hypothetical protein